MRALLTIFLLLLLSSCTGTRIGSAKDPTIVEASCGQCQFGMEGEGCDLAVTIEGKGYFVEGTNIDDHGDAHAEDGFCEAVRKAKVVGKVKRGHFHATHFELLPEQ